MYKQPNEGLDITRPCPECGEETANYYLCDKCVRKKVKEGVDPDELYERELDCWYAYKGY